MIDPELPDEGHGPVTPRVVRQFAGLWLLLMGALTLWQWSKGNTVWASVWATLGLLGVAGLVYPPVMRPVFGTLTAITFPIGWVISNVLLAGLYYLIFTPIGLLFRLIGRDPLRRRGDPAAATFWAWQPTTDDPRTYFRQS